VCLFLLVLIGTVGICLAQSERTGSRRRTSRGSRLKIIQLPDPATNSAVSLERALAAQQQVEPPSDQRLTFPDISQLAWAAQSLFAAPANTPAAVAAAGQRPQFDVYFSLSDGLYLYDRTTHGLQQKSEGDVRREMATALLGRPDAPIGGGQIILVGSSRVFNPYYGPRAKTVMLLQAGQVAQSIRLEALALGLTFVSIENIDSAAVRRTCRLSRGLEPLYVAFIGYPAGAVVATPTEETAATTTRKVVIIAANQGFRDEELLETKRGLERASIQTSVASTRLGTMMGVLGGTIQADLMLGQVNVNDYSAVVFVGGPGAVDLVNNRAALTIARQAFAQRKIVAGIGTAPTILANAGVLRGVRATAYLSERGTLMQAGATYTGNPVERDGTVVTSTGPLAVSAFVRSLLDAMNEAQ
jgi:protease I